MRKVAYSTTPLLKKPRRLCVIPSISASEFSSGELSDSVPPLPAPMPPLSELQGDRQPSLQPPLPLPSPTPLSVDSFPSLQLKKPTHPQPCADLQPLEIPAMSPKPTHTQPLSKKSRKNRLAKDVMFKRRQNKCRQYNLNPKKPIVVENYKPKSLKLPKTWIPELGLQESDKEIILSDTEWLNDRIINAAQKLLKKANPEDESSPHSVPRGPANHPLPNCEKEAWCGLFKGEGG